MSIFTSAKKLVYTGLVLSAFTSSAFAKELNIYNWSDYVAPDVIEQFEKETGIRVNYKEYETNEELENVLLTASEQFDVVVPTIDFMSRQVDIGLYQPIDKSKLPNYKHIDSLVTKSMDQQNTGDYAVPYMWGTTGIGINVAKVKAVLGEDAKLDSLDLLFNESNAEKLAECGIAVVDAPSEIFSLALKYLGQDPHSTVTQDYKAGSEAYSLIERFAKHVRYFDTSRIIRDMTDGSICATIAWSGDIAKAIEDASEDDNGIELAYIIPEEGAVQWFDVFGIPADAKNVDEAHQFIDFMTRPEIAAKNTNYIWYPNPISASLAMVDTEISSDESIYPNDQVLANLFISKVPPPKVNRALTRSWTRIKVGSR